MKHLSHTVILCGSLVLAGWLAEPSQLRARPPKDDPSKAPVATSEQIAFFEKSIRPVLVKECYSCHSTAARKIRGGLTLDTRAGIRKGGDTGPAVVPGDVRKSLLVKAIKHLQDNLKMPPKKKLADDVIAGFEKWIAMGAPDPRDGQTQVVKSATSIEKGRTFWSFQPPRKTPPPPVNDAAWPKDAIDRFLLAGLEAKGLAPVADADARTLLRRIYFDLIGLPPTPEEAAEFAKNYASRSRADLEAVVDRLLSSSAFGERWGRHWLDVARYAESSGRAANFAYPHAWRYRDYVIASFNADKPYDQFIREQLAGDLLDAKDDRQKAEFLVATGLLAIGPKSHDERNRQQFQMDVADEQIDVTFQAFQGLTVSCARCHDHKFDPIPQKDYYALAGVFRSTETCYGTIRIIQSNHPSPLLSLPKNGGAAAGLEPLSADRRSAIEKQIKDVREQSRNLTGDNAFIRRIFLQARSATLQSQLDLYDSAGEPKFLAMGVRDRRFAEDSRLYIRGELDQPGERVKRGFPQVLAAKQPVIKRGSGRRELAEWIASKENPLTARVMANRIWLHLIGRGLVPTPDNFGASGLPASNPALLDHLALTFAEHGWSVKKLIRTIVLSRVYGLSAEFNEKNFEVDPDNVLVWRMPKRRLEAEAMRDAMLALAGRLDRSLPKGSPVARLGEGNVGFRFQANSAAAVNDAHRSVYLPIVRDLAPEALTVFDFPDPSLIIGERATTTIPAQSLYLMNNPFVIRQAAAMADRLLAADEAAGAASTSLDRSRKMLTRAYEFAYARQPSEKELDKAQQFIAGYNRKQTRRATWAALCQALFASAEFGHR